MEIACIDTRRASPHSAGRPDLPPLVKPAIVVVELPAIAASGKMDLFQQEEVADFSSKKARDSAHPFAHLHSREVSFWS